MSSPLVLILDSGMLTILRLVKFAMALIRDVLPANVCVIAKTRREREREMERGGEEKEKSSTD